MYLKLLILTLSSFLISYLGIYFLLPNLRKTFLQTPNIRSSHQVPKPAGGGLPFVFGISLLCFLFDNRVPLLCLPLSIVGFLDDKFYVDKNLRFLFQVITAILIVYENQSLNNFLSNSNLIIYLLLLVFLILFITSIINFTNFMDGMDGLLSSSLVIIFIVAAVTLDISLFSVVGSLLGFLVWNWSPSKVFMGDGGSTFLGAILAASFLKGNTLDSLKILMVASPLLLDAFSCVVRRFCFNQPVFRPHSLHLFQRLHQVGWSHSKITLYYLIPVFILGLLVIYKLEILLIPTLVITIMFAIYLDNNIALPFQEAIKRQKNEFII